MRLSPKQMPGGRAFQVTFRDPRTKKLRCCSLTTTDQTEADAICRDAEILFNDAALSSDAESPRLIAYHPRAVELVLGVTAREHAESRRVKPALEANDVGTLAARIVDLLRANKKFVPSLTEVLSEYESKRYAELFKRCQDLENNVKAMNPLVDEIERLRRVQNKHVHITLADAVKVWKVDYERDGVAEITRKQAFADVDRFLATLSDPERFKLADVRAAHIETWLRESKRVDGSSEPLSPVSKKRMRAYLSSFFTFAVREYDLSENPIDRCKKVGGMSRRPENILAIRRLPELQEFFRRLEPHPYWHSWCGVAIFAGPRWAEQQWLKVDDVYLDENYLRITSRSSGKRLKGTKTGRERNVPIEQTFLKPLLAAYIKRRKQEQLEGETVAERSQWLFPSTIGENPGVIREKSEPGQWSHGSAFHSALRDLISEIRAETGKSLKSKRPSMLEYLNYGPAEWRHCCGTLLGQCGWSSLEISHFMGNSEEMCRRHYVAPPSGQRWPFRFHANAKESNL